MIRVLMNTSAVTPSTILNQDQEYDLNDDLALAFIEAGQAERVEAARSSGRKTQPKSTGTS